jgi:hypothetical protein
MQGLLNLREDDFSLQNGSKGAVMCTGIAGLSLVMVWSPNSPGSVMLLPQYKQLPQIIPSCKFCVINLNENLRIIEMASKTVAPITDVPHIILYQDGRPCLQYDDDLTGEKLRDFVLYGKKLMESKKSFVNKGVKSEASIPGFSIASPYLEFSCKPDGFCYLQYDDAYKGKDSTLSGMGPASGATHGMSGGGVMNPTTNNQYFQGQ